MLLSQKNVHPRDERIQFIEETHKYIVDGSSDGIISVTTLIHEHFPKFDATKVLKMMRNKHEKYPGLSDEQIKESWEKNGKQASGQGTKMHKMIENYYNDIKNDEKDCELIEYKYFLSFDSEVRQKKGFVPYRTEWSIFDGDLDLAGQLDMLYKKDDGTYALYDWKRVKEIKTDNSYEKGLGKLKHLPHCNYYHYSLQLNVYKRILEKRYDMKITEMILVVLHPDNDNYKLHEVFEMNMEIDYIFGHRHDEIN